MTADRIQIKNNELDAQDAAALMSLSNAQTITPAEVKAQAVKGVLALTASKTLHNAASVATSAPNSSAPHGSQPRLGSGAPGSSSGSGINGSGVDRYVNNAETNYQNEINEAAQAAASGGVNYGDGITWPVDPNFPPCPFDPNNVPNTPDAVIAELKLWLHDIQAYKRDTNLIGPLVEFLKNVSAKYPPGTAAGDWINTEMTRLTNITGPGGETLAEMIVQSLRDSSFFGYQPQSQSGSEANCTAQMNALIAMLGASNNPFLQQMLPIAQFYGNPQELQAFFADNEDPTSHMPIYTSDQFWLEEQGQWGSFLVSNTSFTQQAHSMFMDLIDYLIKKYAAMGSLLVLLIMNTMGENMNEQQQSLGAYGSLSSSLSNLAKMEAQVESDFAGMPQGDPTKAQQYITQLRQLLFDSNVQQAIYGGVVPQQILTLYNDVCNVAVSDTSTQPPTQTTIGKLLNSGTPLSPTQWGDIATAINGLPNIPSGGTQPNPAFGQITGDQKSVDSSISSQTQTISTTQGSITSKINNLQSAIKDILVTQYSENWVHTLVQNQQKASS